MYGSLALQNNNESKTKQCLLGLFLYIFSSMQKTQKRWLKLLNIKWLYILTMLLSLHRKGESITFLSFFAISKNQENIRNISLVLLSPYKYCWILKVVSGTTWICLQIPRTDQRVDRWRTFHAHELFAEISCIICFRKIKRGASGPLLASPTTCNTLPPFYSICAHTSLPGHPTKSAFKCLFFRQSSLEELL